MFFKEAVRPLTSNKDMVVLRLIFISFIYGSDVEQIVLLLLYKIFCMKCLESPLQRWKNAT